MILVAAMVVVLTAVWVRGGRLSRLATLELHAPALAVAAVLVQVVLLSLLPASTPWGLSVALHVGSYGLALAFVLRNRHLAGVRLLFAGGLANLVAIAANRGVMPVSAAALRAVGRHVDAGFSNAAPVSGAHFRFLGDVLPVPGPFPLGNVVSVGDLVLLAGATLLVHRACVERSYKPATARTPSRSLGRKRSGRVTHTA